MESALFYYDGSFDGLLSSLFDAYSRREIPDELAVDGEPVPMFASKVYRVMTDIEKSGRVWRAFEKKVPKYISNMIMHVWLSEEHGSDKLIFNYMKKVFDAREDITANFGDGDVLRMENLARKVSVEGMRMKMFVRFQKTSDGTYFAPVAPVFNSLPVSIDYFRDRFADQKWLIYDTKRRYGYAYDLERVVEVTLNGDDDIVDGKLPEKMLDSEEQLFQRLWRSYHKALTVKERLNPKLQRRFMPRRYWKYLTEM